MSRNGAAWWSRTLPRADQPWSSGVAVPRGDGWREGELFSGGWARRLLPVAIDLELAAGRDAPARRAVVARELAPEPARGSLGACAKCAVRLERDEVRGEPQARSGGAADQTGFRQA